MNSRTLSTVHQSSIHVCVITEDMLHHLKGDNLAMLASQSHEFGDDLGGARTESCGSAKLVAESILKGEVRRMKTYRSHG